jgi:uncharacterized membrane protein (DUF106 family)
MEQNQIHLSQEQKELIEKAFRNFEKFYTPTMRNFATVIAKTVQSIYTEENIQMMQKAAIAIEKIKIKLGDVSNTIKENQNLHTEFSKIAANLHRFSDNLNKISTKDEFGDLLCDTANNLEDINPDELKNELQASDTSESKLSSVDFAFILTLIGLIISLYSIYLGQNSASKQDLEPIKENQSQIQEGIQKLEQISSVLVEQNKQLQAKVDRLEQNQKRNSQNNHSFDSDKQSKKSQAHNQQKRQHKQKE